MRLAHPEQQQRVDLDGVDMLRPLRQRRLDVIARACADDQDIVAGRTARITVQEIREHVARARMADLFRSVKGFRIGQAIPREELYERGSLR